MQIKIHSTTDIITNSSETIFTYSDNSPKMLEKMIDEIFKVLGVDHKCNDIFRMTVMLEDYTCWFDCQDDEDESDVKLPPEFKGADYHTRYKLLNAVVDDICSGKIKKPAWLKKMEEEIAQKQEEYSYPPSTVMHVVAKDPKWDGLADLVVKFLYSTQHEACREG